MHIRLHYQVSNIFQDQVARTGILSQVQALNDKPIMYS